MDGREATAGGAARLHTERGLARGTTEPAADHSDSERNGKQMIFQTHFRSDSGDYSYFIASAKTRQAAVIDPHGDSLDACERLLDSLEFDLRYTLQTGGVADSPAAAVALRRRFGTSSVVPSDAGAGGALIRAGHGDVVCLGDLDLETLGRPGLPNRRVAYRLDDRVFTGDACIRGESSVLGLPPETLVYRSREVRGSYFGLLALEAGPSDFERGRWRSGEGERYLADLTPPRTTSLPFMPRVA
jgi:glyoxylase-like metal-dependent hydrolase (beta-lactamase superfamily II)